MRTWSWVQQECGNSITNLALLSSFKCTLSWTGAPLCTPVLCLVAQSCLILSDPMDCSPPGSSVHGDSPGKNTGVGCHALLQGIFLTQGSNPGLPYCRWILPCLNYEDHSALLAQAEWRTAPPLKPAWHDGSMKVKISIFLSTMALNFLNYNCRVFLSVFPARARAHYKTDQVLLVSIFITSCKAPETINIWWMNKTRNKWVIVVVSTKTKND